MTGSGSTDSNFISRPNEAPTERLVWANLLAVIFGAHLLQKVDRLFHFIHAVHAILNADPTIVARRFQNGENLVIVIQAFAGDAVA